MGRRKDLREQVTQVQEAIYLKKEMKSMESALQGPAKQDHLFGLGLANTFGSFFSAYPAMQQVIVLTYIAKLKCLID
ncbi:hypothetical protein Tco_0624709 [Tanacetum coccineum]|uniref:Uncharacterized protein n=1 Tax=Tanacetum coccineum TaxID=301880 RepID=A0ABQ4WEP8_9ASTR